MVDGITVAYFDVEPGICYHRPQDTAVFVVTEIRDNLFWVKYYPNQARCNSDRPELTITLSPSTPPVTL